MTRRVNIHEAKTHFSKLIEAVESGEEVIVARSGKPVVKLVRIEEPQVDIKPGFAKVELAEWADIDWTKLDKRFNQLFKDN